MTNYFGELISIGVAVSWTLTALCFEFAGRRIGALQLNLLRLLLSLVMLGGTLYWFRGFVVPFEAGGEAWFWLAISGLVGYVFGDYCLFNSYLVIGSRFGQLFMTLAPPAAALAGWLILGERMAWSALLGMAVTLFGIALSVFSRGGSGESRIQLKLPLRGVLLGVGAGLGQGVGLVFSKLGMEHYVANLDPGDVVARSMVPFAATEIRAIFGVIGFSLLLWMTGKLKSLPEVIKDRPAMGVLTIGTLFGPFLGVSFSLMAVQYTSTGVASTLMALTPIFILLPAYLFMRQRITWMELLGAVISVGGVALFFI